MVIKGDTRSLDNGSYEPSISAGGSPARRLGSSLNTCFWGSE